MNDDDSAFQASAFWKASIYILEEYGEYKPKGRRFYPQTVPPNNTLVSIR
jgi:hypothetical protein